jgi:hypothetical protein
MLNCASERRLVTRNHNRERSGKTKVEPGSGISGIMNAKAKSGFLARKMDEPEPHIVPASPNPSPSVWARKKHRHR